MRVLGSGVFWGVLLVVTGSLLLLEALGVSAIAGWIWAGLFGAAGIGFAYVFSTSRENWWAAIPAGALLGLAALVAWGEFAPASADEWGGSLFLGGLGAGFLAVYLRGRENWWAIIPGGVLLTLALMSGLSPIIGGTASSAVFFLGLAATFGLLALVPAEEGRMRWPLIPAAVLGVMGVLFALGAVEILNAWNYIWPAALIAGGLYLIARTFGSGRRTRPHA